MTRGIRNNNPLNIRQNPRNRWYGLRPRQTDGAFCQFVHMKWGLRAALLLLRKYIQRGLQTPRQIISRWAPPSENQTERYVQDACRMAGGLDPDAPILYWKELRALAGAMSWIESRYKPTDAELDEALHLALDGPEAEALDSAPSGQLEILNGKW